MVRNKIDDKNIIDMLGIDSKELIKIKKENHMVV